ncbi:MAG: alpha-amylase [Anaerolineae bacterium]|nr:alpha-amylase [Anaerolineae bacterium]
MALDTPKHYRNLVIYEIYVRNHGPHGTFADVEADLPRIKALGVDVIWFMPIHPIGKQNKKGSLGCPYAIADYRGVNPEYGSREDFARLIARAHALGLKVMIDVVYNHTAHDSVLVREHPEWFHQDARGVPVTTVPEWSDVIDLKHPNPELADYLIETLQQWATFGVDGFRCDVASLLPLDFWLRARAATAAVKPGVIWLAESVHAGFIEQRRADGLSGLSDSEVFQAFDLTYVYDIWPLWQAAVQGEEPVERYLEMVRFQEACYPANYVKLRYVENHDQLRIMDFAPGRNQALAWTAFEAFNKGAFLIYGGQESAAAHRPSLFDIDKVEWGDYALAPFLSRLTALKKDPAQVEGHFVILAAAPAIQAAWRHPETSLFGVFNVKAAEGQVAVPLADGRYEDVLSGETVEVRQGKTPLPETAFILRYAGTLPARPFYAPLMDR